MIVMLPPEILLHADVGQGEGWGHLRECLAVARALESHGITAGFIIPAEAETAKEQVAQEGYPLYTLPSATWQNSKLPDSIHELISKEKTRFVVANLVEVSTHYVEVISRATQGWAIITEHADQELAPLNFNISKNPELIPLDGVYCCSPHRVIRKNVHEMLVCFGGADPKNICGLVLEMLRQSFDSAMLPGEIQVTAVLGPLFRHTAVVRAMRATYPTRLEVIGPLTPRELAELVRSADLAITTGGDTMYEFCALGLPSIVVPVLKKMEMNAKVLSEKGAVWQTARADYLSPKELAKAVDYLLDGRNRRAMVKVAQAAVDGCGAERIVARLIDVWRLK